MVDGLNQIGGERQSMYVQLCSPFITTTMRTPAALSAPRRRPLPRSWFPASRVSVAPVSESVALCESPLRAACALYPRDARSRVTSATASAREGPGAFAGCGVGGAFGCGVAAAGALGAGWTVGPAGGGAGCQFVAELPVGAGVAAG